MKKIFIIFLLLLTGCSSNKYVAAPLESIKSRPKSSQKVFVFYKPLSKNESKHYLGKNWMSKGYLPVQIAIENHGEDPVKFYRKGIGLPTEDLVTIKEKAHGFKKAKAMAIGAPSITCVSLGLIGLALAPATFGLSGTLLPIAIGGTGIQTASKIMQSEANLERDYDEKFLRDVEIEPGSSHEGIVFVPKDEFIEKFQVRYIDGKTNKMIKVQSKRFQG